MLKQFLSALPLFKDFSSERLDSLIAASREEKYKPGETIIEIGRPGQTLFIMIEGKASANIEDADGGKNVIGSIGIGEFFGEMSLMTGEPTSATIIAEKVCEVLVIPQEIFSTYLITNPTAVKLLAKTIADRLKKRKDDSDDKERRRGAWMKNPDPYGLALHSPKPLKLLVVNSGSSSLKYNYFDTDNPKNDMRGSIERIGKDGSRHFIKSVAGEVALEEPFADHAKAFDGMIRELLHPARGVVRDLSEIGAVGHRVVHGGGKYSEPVMITQKILEDIEALSDLAPLHNPPNALGIRESLKKFPNAVQVAVFDTAFHHSIPAQAHVYGLPYEMYAEKGIRRYGFHGVSHNFVSLKAAEHLKKKYNALRIITCHLGNGASVCAVDHGRSVDVSMGLTPTEGLLMGTRCGDLDPSIVLYMQRKLGMSAAEVAEMLDQKSGLKGVSGISNDMREIEAAAIAGDRRAILALQVFCYRVKKYIGAYAAAMGGVDAIVFTGGIGAGSTGVRASVCQGLNYMGVALDELKNKTSRPAAGEVADISDDSANVATLLIPTDEERMIARETIRSMGFRDIAEASKNWDDMPILVEASAHHVHLTKEHMAALFGPDADLTVKAYLSQPGEFASNEQVNVIGPKGTVERVRILGPYRKATQVEVSITDEFRLGINAPVRASGKIEGTPGATLEGPKGKVVLDKGVINALRHIHMTPEDALAFGLRDRDMVRVRVEGPRSLIFGEVLVRVDPNYKLSMHLDTDEANAAEVTTGMKGFIEGIHDRV